MVELGIDRVLTSGGQPTAIDGADRIKSLQENYGKDIEILAGSGVNYNNASSLMEHTGISQVHSSCKDYEKILQLQASLSLIAIILAHMLMIMKVWTRKMSKNLSAAYKTNKRYIITFFAVFFSGTLTNICSSDIFDPSTIIKWFYRCCDSN